MKYQFLEEKTSYTLTLNGKPLKIYLKHRYSRMEAEMKASAIVTREIKKGKPVEYDGVICG